VKNDLGAGIKLQIRQPGLKLKGFARPQPHEKLAGAKLVTPQGIRRQFHHASDKRAREGLVCVVRQAFDVARFARHLVDGRGGYLDVRNGPPDDPDGYTGAAITVSLPATAATRSDDGPVSG
jgi:hypothetical protein